MTKGEIEALIVQHMRASSEHTVWPMSDDSDPDMYCGYLSFEQVGKLADALALTRGGGVPPAATQHDIDQETSDPPTDIDRALAGHHGEGSAAGGTPQPVKILPDTEHDGGEVFDRWLPIETAPKEELMPILTWGDERPNFSQVQQFSRWLNGNFKQASGWYSGECGLHYPKMWRPLPPPPRTGGEG